MSHRASAKGFARLLPSGLRRGFTIAELIIAVAILGIIFASTLPFAGLFQQRQTLETYRQDIIQALRRAQHRSVAGEQDIPWGVYLQPNAYTFYGGSLTYATRNPTFDRVVAMRGGYVLSGLTDVAFEKLTGKPTASGDITITRSEVGSKIIEITGEGSIGPRPDASDPIPPGINPYSDLELTSKVGTQTAIFPNQPEITYTYTIKNTGTNPISRLRLTDYFPTEIDWSGAGINPYDCGKIPGQRLLVCDILSDDLLTILGHSYLGPGETITPLVAFIVNAPPCPRWTGDNYATISSDVVDDIDLGNNYAIALPYYIDQDCPAPPPPPMCGFFPYPPC